MGQVLAIVAVGLVVAGCVYVTYKIGELAINLGKFLIIELGKIICSIVCVIVVASINTYYYFRKKVNGDYDYL